MTIEQVHALKVGDEVRTLKSGKVYRLLSLCERRVWTLDSLRPLFIGCEPTEADVKRSNLCEERVWQEGRGNHYRQVRTDAKGTRLYGPSFVSLKPANIEKI